MPLSPICIMFLGAYLNHSKLARSSFPFLTFIPETFKRHIDHTLCRHDPSTKLN